MNFNAINAHLIVGSHPSNAADIVNLYNHNRLRAVVNLQQSGEPDRGNMDEITAECAALGNRIWYQRVLIQDESKESLRINLPEAVGILNRAIQEKAKEPGETVYLHCCRGIGRSPSVAVAYLYWFTDMDLNPADALVRAARHVAVPNLLAIREATNNILQANVIGNITAVQRGLIQQFVTGLPRVTNA
jgi:hypothetical protein